MSDIYLLRQPMERGINDKNRAKMANALLTNWKMPHEDHLSGG